MVDGLNVRTLIACQKGQDKLSRPSLIRVFPVSYSDKLFVLFYLILYLPVNNFQLSWEGSSWVEPELSKDKCVLLKDHNPVMPVRLEPTALRSRVKHSTTEPLRSLQAFYKLQPWKQTFYLRTEREKCSKFKNSYCSKTLKQWFNSLHDG